MPKELGHQRANMHSHPIELVLMPGLDGTGRLFQCFAECLSPRLRPRIVRYPQGECLGYEELLPWVFAHFIEPRPCVLLGESFSGPLAVMAAQHRNIQALVLSASFLTPPSRRCSPGLIALLKPLMGRWPNLPDWMIRRYLLGADAGRDRITMLQEAVSEMNPPVLLHRLGEIARCDVTESFRRLAMPVLYLAGTEDKLVKRRCYLQMK